MLSENRSSHNEILQKIFMQEDLTLKEFHDLASALGIKVLFLAVPNDKPAAESMASAPPNDKPDADHTMPTDRNEASDFSDHKNPYGYIYHLAADLGEPDPLPHWTMWRKQVTDKLPKDAEPYECLLLAARCGVSIATECASDGKYELANWVLLDVITRLVAVYYHLDNTVPPRKKDEKG